MTFLEYVNKLLDGIRDKKSLDFKTADQFIERIDSLKYTNGNPLSYEDKVAIIDLLKSEATKRKFSFQYFINDSTNASSLSVIAHMMNKINEKSKPVKTAQVKKGGTGNGTKWITTPY